MTTGGGNPRPEAGKTTEEPLKGPLSPSGVSSASGRIRYCLDPREVTVIRDPENGDAIIGYVWEPVGEVPQPIRTHPWANPRLIGRSESRRQRRRRLGLRWWQKETK